MGPLFFITFVLIMFSIVMNIAIAAIDHAHGEVQDKYEHRENPHSRWVKSLKSSLSARLPDKIKTWRAALKEKKDVERAQYNVIAADVNADNKLDRAEATDMLNSQQEMARYLGVDNVDDLFAMYDLDHDGQLDLQEQAQIMERLEAERERYNAICRDLAADGNQDMDDQELDMASSAMSAFRLRQVAAADGSATGTAADPSALSTRVDSLETLVGSLHGKIDVAMDLLQAINRNVSRRGRRRTGSVSMNRLSVDGAGGSTSTGAGAGL